MVQWALLTMHLMVSKRHKKKQKMFWKEQADHTQFLEGPPMNVARDLSNTVMSGWVFPHDIVAHG